MNKKNTVLLVIFVFVVSGLFYRQVFRPKNVTENDSTLETGKKDTTDSNPMSREDALDISNKNLDKLPDYVLKLTNLEELNISHNKITGALPAEIHDLKNLIILNASNNLMTGVPAELGQLENLEVLDLSNNDLTGLPNELGNLKKLKILNLSGNDYSQQDLDVIKKGLPSDVKIIL